MFVRKNKKLSPFRKLMLCLVGNLWFWNETTFLSYRVKSLTTNFPGSEEQPIVPHADVSRSDLVWFGLGGWELCISVNFRDAAGGDRERHTQLNGSWSERQSRLLQCIGATCVLTSRLPVGEGVKTQGAIEALQCLNSTFLMEFFVFPSLWCKQAGGKRTDRRGKQGFWCLLGRKLNQRSQYCLP